MVALALLAGAVLGGWAVPASADVQSVTGSAYGYSLDVSLFGSPTTTRGFGQVACTGPNTPPGCVDDPTVSDSPAVTLPSTGGNVSASDPGGATAQVGPAIFFSATGLSVSTSGSIGPGGSVTSSATASGVNASGQESFTASTVMGSCTASESGVSGTTAIAGGTVEVDSGEDLNDDGDYTDRGEHPPVVVAVPENPDPGFTLSGHLHVNDTVEEFEYIFNEQVVNADGSITVSAVHQRLLGPTAVGDLIVGRAVCGVATGLPSSLSVSISDSPDPVAPGDVVTYTVTVANASGAGPATGVTVLSTLSAGRILSATSDGGTCTVLKGRNKGVSCDLATIPGGNDTTITIAVKAPRNADVMTVESTVTGVNTPASETTSVVKP
ncbi:MAG: hypothetical protein ACRD0N_04990 [Acidimicrobiales bacterium]